MDRIMLGNGSDELIDLIVRAFVSVGDQVVSCPPTFDMYQVYTEGMGGRLVQVPRLQDFRLDVETVLHSIGDRTKLVFLASPNSPTGNVTELSVVERLAKASPLLVLDEAYAEFSGQNGIPLAIEYDNVIVLRSLSKWAGLAGLRVGYGVFPADVMPYLNTLRSPYNVNQAAQLAVQVTLAHADLALANVRKLCEERDKLFRELKGFGFLRVHPSQTNFIFTEVIGLDARRLQTELAGQGVMVRCYAQPALQRYLRIGVGTADDNRALLEALNKAAKRLHL